MQMQENQKDKTPTVGTVDKITTLESIFLAHASRRRNKFGQAQFVRFVHYTSAEAALKIISQKRIWMRSTACMTDYMEVQHGFTILNRFFSDKGNETQFINAVNNVAQGAAEEAMANFNKWWQARIIQFQTYIFSVSEHDDREDNHGRLSMWRASGNNKSRVAIVFKIPRASEAVAALAINFGPVAYLTDDEMNKLVPDVIENIGKNEVFLKAIPRQEIVNWIFHMLLWSATCIKHAGFHEEREWRVVYSPLIFKSQLVTTTTETIGGVPQIVFNIPIDRTVNPKLEDIDISKIFDRLIIGPSQYPITMMDAFDIALSAAGVIEARKKICISDIPIRS
jgi:hypothetical protein